MKLTTDIKPRKDGEVTASVPGTPSVPGSSYRFTNDGTGRLVASIAHDAHVAYLLDTGNFYPADEGDIEAGITATLAALDGGDGADDEGGAPALAVPVKAKGKK